MGKKKPKAREEEEIVTHQLGDLPPIIESAPKKAWTLTVSYARWSKMEVPVDDVDDVYDNVLGAFGALRTSEIEREFTFQSAECRCEECTEDAPGKTVTYSLAAEEPDDTSEEKSFLKDAAHMAFDAAKLLRYTVGLELVCNDVEGVESWTLEDSSPSEPPPPQTESLAN